MRNTAEINKALYWHYFIDLNKISQENSHLSQENEAFELCQKNDYHLAKIREISDDLDNMALDIKRLAPDLENTKSKATDNENLQALLAKQKLLETSLANIKKQYPELRTKATNEFNQCLRNINNAPGIDGPKEMTPVELGRQTLITQTQKVATMYQKVTTLKNEMHTIHQALSDYHRTLAGPKLREKTSVAEKNIAASAAASRPTGSTSL